LRQGYPSRTPCKTEKTAERWHRPSVSAGIADIVPESFPSPPSFPSLRCSCSSCVLCSLGVLPLYEAVCVLCGVLFSLVVVVHARRSVLPHVRGFFGSHYVPAMETGRQSIESEDNENRNKSRNRERSWSL